MKLGIAEILKGAADKATHRERVEFLRRHDNTALRTVCRLAYDETLVWDLPKKWKPDYRPSPYLDTQSGLYQEARKLGKFLVGGHDGLTQERKTSLFLQLLEALDAEDAEVMASVATQRKIPFKGLGRATIKEAFPDLLPEEK